MYMYVIHVVCMQVDTTHNIHVHVHVYMYMYMYDVFLYTCVVLLVNNYNYDVINILYIVQAYHWSCSDVCW